MTTTATPPLIGQSSKPATKPPLERALADLAAIVEKRKLDKQTVAKRFADDYGMDIRKADPKTVGGVREGHRRGVN